MRFAFALLFVPTLPLLHAQDLEIQQQQIVQQQIVQQEIQSQTQSFQQSMTDAMAQSAQTFSGQLLPKPRLSMKPGIYPGAISIRLEDRRMPQVEMYYTTNGWTPTPMSTHYTGPITIDETTHLQAIAVLGVERSRVVSAVYSVSAKVPGSGRLQTPGGTARIVFTAPMPSKGAQIGDAVPLALGEDLIIDGFVVPKGTPVNGTVTHAIPAQWGGMPGSITFAVHSVNFGDQSIPLMGTEKLEGVSSADVPFHHGHDVIISLGATLTARVLPKNSVMASR